MKRSTSVFGLVRAVTALCLCSAIPYGQQTLAAGTDSTDCDFSAAVTARPFCSANANAQKSKTPTISQFLLRDMKAAQDAQKAQNWSLEVQKLKAAQTAHGSRTPYDDYVINSWLGVADAELKDYAHAAPALEAAGESQYAAPAQQKVLLPTAVSFYSQLQQYSKAIDVGQYAIKHGIAEPAVYVTVAVDQKNLGQYQQAAATIQQLIDTEPKPEEQYLSFQLDAYEHASDQPDENKVIGELVTYYPKPDYWLVALQPLLKMSSGDSHLQLEVYRLMNEVGALKTSNAYAQMAELSFGAGYPAETVAVLQKAFATDVFTNPDDIMRYQHMLSGAMQKMTADEASLPSQEAKAEMAATGDPLVAVGAAYLSYGQADKAASVISQGIAKGSLKYAEEANLLLGMAQLKSHDAAGASNTFDKVGKSDNAGYAQLGSLWALHSKPPATT